MRTKYKIVVAATLSPWLAIPISCLVLPGHEIPLLRFPLYPAFLLGFCAWEFIGSWILMLVLEGKLTTMRLILSSLIFLVFMGPIILMPIVLPFGLCFVKFGI